MKEERSLLAAASPNRIPSQEDAQVEYLEIFEMNPHLRYHLVFLRLQKMTTRESNEEEESSAFKLAEERPFIEACKSNKTSI